MNRASAVYLGSLTLLSLLMGDAGMAQDSEPAPSTEYLSDVIYGISAYKINYGNMLGIDTTSYPLWPKATPGDPIRIKDQSYDKGIGAPYGSVVIMLDGQYEEFTAQVGLQTGTEGSGFFRVTVDDEEKFHSGSMTAADEPRPVRVSVRGAQQMQLTAAGATGLVWADAKLVRAVDVLVPEPVDMAPFARVVTFDPARSEGVGVNRLTEFPAEDVFHETELPTDDDGAYTVPVAKNGQACIGLQWIERRRLRRIGLQFADPDRIPSPRGVRVEGWIKKDPFVLDGHSHWQGKWTPLAGEIQRQADWWFFDVGGAANREVAQGTYKLRWVFPADEEAAEPPRNAAGQEPVQPAVEDPASPSRSPIRIRRLTALTTSQWDTTTLTLQCENATTGRYGEIDIYNGEILAPADSSDPWRRRWDMAGVLRLKLHYTKKRPWGFDRTVLRMSLPDMRFGVAVDDVLENGCVYVKEAGVFVAAESLPTTPAQYKESIKGTTTLVQQVRQMPDQDFAKVREKIYMPVQNRGPTLLSLPWDNRKVIVRRSGEIGYGPFYLDYVQQRNKHLVIPQMGTGEQHAFSDVGAGSPAGYQRRLDNGWMPIPHITVEEGGTNYHQTVFVVPCDTPAPSGQSPYLYSHPLCAAEYVIENLQPEPSSAALRLDFIADAESSPRKTARLESSPGRVLAKDGDDLLAVVDVREIEILRLGVEEAEGVLVLTGQMPPNSRERFQVYMPMQWELPPESPEALTGGIDLRERVEALWRDIMAPSLQIDIPDKLLQNIITASQVHCMLAARNEEEGRCIDPWISSAYYASLDTESHAILYGMDLMGHHDFARRSLNYFIKRQNPAGYLSHGYTLVGTGHHLWYLSDHYRLTGDEAWWRSVAPQVARICRWVTQQVDKTRRLDVRGERVPQHGLVPPGTVADWQDWGYIFSANGFYYGGLDHAARALDMIGYPQSDEFTRAAGQMRTDIQGAYERTQSLAPVIPRGDGTWIPLSPYRALCPGPIAQFFPNYDGAWLYEEELGPHWLVDTGVFDPQDPKVGWMIDYLENQAFYNNSHGVITRENTHQDWFNWGGFGRAQPFYGRYVQMYARRDEVKLFLRSYFNQLAVMFNREDLSIYENPGASVWNKTFETGNFLQQSRLMFLMERGDELWLAPFITSHWLKDGMAVAIEHGPTHFGDVSYRIESHVNDGYIEARIDPPARRKPRELVLRIRHPHGERIRKVEVNGTLHSAFDPAREIIRLDPASDALTIRAFY